ncbi:helix-turn-helix domain-containing protein [Enterococcus mediterraneensis]|uniref:helix-turn-helix domain-containing protein n=1 Tax=Enterococcus mediterraneensis TaxID=2364791 RepID=UPI000F058040|nr:helix-turn-helix transcriptional regulator [Enterococcus mediterraneensis]
MIPVNKSKLHEKMKEKKMVDADMARQLGITRATYSRKMSGIIVVSLPEFIKMMNVLEVKDEELSSFLLRK